MSLTTKIDPIEPEPSTDDIMQIVIPICIFLAILLAILLAPSWASDGRVFCPECQQVDQQGKVYVVDIIPMWGTYLSPSDGYYHYDNDDCNEILITLRCGMGHTWTVSIADIRDTDIGAWQ